MRICLALFLLALQGCSFLGGQPAAVTPQRPTVSSDTNTTKEGTFEVEFGITADPGDAFDSPFTLKWGADPRTEIFVGWSPYLAAARPGPDAEGVGDTLVGVRHRLTEESESTPAMALQLQTKLPTGDRGQGLSSGETDFFLAAILSKNFGPVGVTTFYQAGLIGDPASPDTGLTHTLALAAGAPISDQVGGFGELAGLLDPEADREIWQITLGATYTLSQDFVFDVAVVIGLNHAAQDVQWIAGFTKNLGSLRTDRPRTR